MHRRDSRWSQLDDKGEFALVLSDLRIGQCARILRVNGGGELRRRLLDMGLTPNTIVKLVRVAPLGDPIELCLRGYNLSLRGEAARDIEVEVLTDDQKPCGRSCMRQGNRGCSNDANSRFCTMHDEPDDKMIERDEFQDGQLRPKRKRRRWLRNR